MAAEAMEACGCNVCECRHTSLGTSVLMFCICCRTKNQLANEIDDYTKKLLEDYEDLDKLTIQADIWHSKYRASRSVNITHSHGSARVVRTTTKAYGEGQNLTPCQP